MKMQPFTDAGSVQRFQIQLWTHVVWVRVFVAIIECPLVNTPSLGQEDGPVLPARS